MARVTQRETKDGAVIKKTNRYANIIEHIFHSRYKAGARLVDFKREDIVSVANELGIQLPKNLGDVIYSFRYRAALPDTIRATAPNGEVWVIRPSGRALYQFALVADAPISPSLNLGETKLPDATPGIVLMYSGNDEQALLAKLRYNRLVDIFTGVTSYSLQNHLRTTVPSMGQIETDEIYVGIDHRGSHYVFPVQAKGGNDRMNIVQIEQDIALCQAKFPNLICIAIGAQFISNDKIALFAFEESEQGVVIVQEKHYRLTMPDQITHEELQNYRNRPKSM
ncbi:MAG: hypothetical protein OHK0029_10020 [Armatimonadaceae bacterium]